MSISLFLCPFTSSFKPSQTRCVCGSVLHSRPCTPLLPALLSSWVTQQIPFSHLSLVKYQQNKHRGFPVQPLTAQLLTGTLDAQSSPAQLLHPKPALLLLVIHGYPAAPSLNTEHSTSEQNSQQKSRHLMSTWNCVFPFNSNPNQHR